MLGARDDEAAGERKQLRGWVVDLGSDQLHARVLAAGDRTRPSWSGVAVWPARATFSEALPTTWAETVQGNTDSDQHRAGHGSIAAFLFQPH